MDRGGRRGESVVAWEGKSKKEKRQGITAAGGISPTLIDLHGGGKVQNVPAGRFYLFTLSFLASPVLFFV